MIKREVFIKQLAENMGTTQKEAKVALDATLNTLADCFAKGQGVQFIGFGAFPVSMVPAREGTNPQTGKKIKIAAHRKVAFKPSKALKDLIG